MKTTLMLVLMSFLLCSCLSPIKSEPLNRYVLKGVSQKKYANSNHPITLLVTQPSADPGYQSEEIVYVNKEFQLNHYSKNVWVAPPSQLLLPLLVESLRNTNYFHAVVSPPYVGDTDLRLETQLLKLQQEFFSKRSHVRLSLQVNLINNHTNKIISTRTFNSIMEARTMGPYGGVVAANQATEALMQQITAFVMTSLK